jgi:hypothetical protein
LIENGSESAETARAGAGAKSTGDYDSMFK